MSGLLCQKISVQNDSKRFAHTAATIRWFEYGLGSRIKNHWNAIETLRCADTKLFGSQTTLFVTKLWVFFMILAHTYAVCKWKSTCQDTTLHISCLWPWFPARSRYTVGWRGRSWSFNKHCLEKKATPQYLPVGELWHLEAHPAVLPMKAMTMLLVGLLGPHASETRHKKVLNTYIIRIQMLGCMIMDKFTETLQTCFTSQWLSNIPKSNTLW